MAGESPRPGGSSFIRLAAGSRIASYRLEHQVGAGGMAVVFRARDERLGRTVALKVMAPGLAADPGFRQRFIRESRAAAAVDDPHILPVYEAGEADGVLFIAMRYVSGGDLRSLAAREGTLGPGRAAWFISAAAAALDAAHAAGLVHRDIKPANMLIDSRPGQPDHLYLSDFGLSKGALSAAASASLTGSAEVFGTPDYCAPEQASGAKVDARTDQYALACVAFTLLAGVPVFPRDHPVAVLMAHMSAPPPSVLRLRPELPQTVDQVLARALAKAPENRYPSCGRFAAALHDALGQPSPNTAAAAASPPAQAHQQVAQPLAEATHHAETLTAATRGPLQAGSTTGPQGIAPAGPLGTAPITAPASLPGPEQPPGAKRLLGRRPRAVAAALAAAILAAGAVLTARSLLRTVQPSTPTVQSSMRTIQPSTRASAAAAGGSTVSFACKVEQTGGDRERYVVYATGGDAYRGTVQVSFYDYAGSGHVFQPLSLPGTAAEGSAANWHPVPAADIGASAEPSGCIARTAQSPVARGPVVTCDNPIWGQQAAAYMCGIQRMVSQPQELNLSGDSTLVMTGILWSGWGAATASGTGQLAMRSCTPNCAGGKTSYYAATVTASHLVPYGSGQAYDSIKVSSPSAPNGYGTGGGYAQTWSAFIP